MKKNARIWMAAAFVLTTVFGGFAAATTVFAENQCQCGCRAGGPGGEIVSGGRTCTSSAECSQAACRLVCESQHLEMQPSTGNLPCEAVTAPARQPGTCAFKCRPASSPSAAGVTAQVIVGCSIDADCTAACRDRCTRPGDYGNGLSEADGTGLACQINRTDPPHCVVPNAAGSGSGAPGAGGASTPSSQTANTAATLPNPVGTTDLVELIGRVTKAIMGILGALALLWMVWGGILWMTAEESKRTEDAKAIMKNAALGIILLFFSYGLATAFLGIFQEAASSTDSAPSSAESRTTRTGTTQSPSR